MTKPQLTLEQQALKEKRKKEKYQKQFDIAYQIALKEPSLPKFRIQDGVILIKRISDNQLKQYKRIWLKTLKQQIKEFTVENLCECWNEPFEVDIRQYNPKDLILQYFYHKHYIDLIFPEIPYKIVDKF